MIWRRSGKLRVDQRWKNTFEKLTGWSHSYIGLLSGCEMNFPAGSVAIESFCYIFISWWSLCHAVQCWELFRKLMILWLQFFTFWCMFRVNFMDLWIHILLEKVKWILCSAGYCGRFCWFQQLNSEIVSVPIYAHMWVF